MTFTPAETILDWLRARSHQQDRHRADNVYRARSKDGTDTITLVTYPDGEWTLLTSRCAVWSTNEHRPLNTIFAERAESVRAALANYYTSADLEGLP